MASKFRLRKTIRQLNNTIKQLEENQLSYLKAKTAAQGKIYGYWYHATGDQTCTSTVTVDLDTNVEISDNSHFTLSNGEITINVGGVYEVVYSVNTDVSSGTARSGSRAWLERNNGSWSTLPGSESFMYNRGSPYGENTSSSSLIYTFNTGDKIRIRCEQHHGADTVYVLAGGSALTLTTL